MTVTEQVGLRLHHPGFTDPRGLEHRTGSGVRASVLRGGLHTQQHLPGLRADPVREGEHLPVDRQLLR